MKISILGMGAYGIALGKVFHNNENKVSIWTKFKEELDSVSLVRENVSVLKGVKIPKAIELTDNMSKSVEQADIVVVAIPMNAVRQVLKELSEIIEDKQVVCLVTKGIEEETGKFVSEIAEEELKGHKNICMLSGPSIAQEIAEGASTGFVIASEYEFASLSVKVCLENKNIVVDISKDLMGVQVASAVKNVFAILCGMLEGMDKKCSDSLRAAVLSKLVFDLQKIIIYFGGMEETFVGFAGLGDMLLTCMSNKSRNYTFGKLLGEGKSTNSALKSMNVSTIEGLTTLNILYKILQDKNLKVKSIDTLYNIVYKDKKIDNVLKNI